MVALSMCCFDGSGEQLPEAPASVHSSPRTTPSLLSGGGTAEEVLDIGVANSVEACESPTAASNMSLLAPDDLFSGRSVMVCCTK